LYGDNLTEVNLLKMYAFHKDHEWPFTLGVFKADEPERCGIADIDESGKVVDFVEKAGKPPNPIWPMQELASQIRGSLIFSRPMPKRFVPWTLDFM